MMGRRVVITGLGALTPVGNDVATSWQAVIAGQSGIGRITAFDPSSLKTQIVGELKDFDPTRHMDKKDARRLDRAIQMAMNASAEALADAALLTDELDRERVGVIIGSGLGGIQSLLSNHDVLAASGPARISPFFVPSVLPDMSAGYVSIQFDLRGPNMAIITACATGNNAIGEAMHMILRGDIDAAVAGGVESPITALSVVGFDQMGALASNFNDRPTQSSRPFDKDRSGFVMGEGAGILILEERIHALRRGAHIYAELAGYATTSDAHHIAAPEPSGAGAARAMRLALQKAGLPPTEIGYINAHGTSTPLNDAIETRAIRTVFGPHAEKLAISSTKSETGHLLGAAGAVEAVFSVLALQKGILPPTINLDTPDPECDLDYVPHKARQQRVSAVLSNSFGFGGHNACLIFIQPTLRA